jgi:hypothetical protein
MGRWADQDDVSKVPCAILSYTILANIDLRTSTVSLMVRNSSVLYASRFIYSIRYILLNLCIGMQRIGYDADTQVFTFRDTTSGAIFESEPGNRFGELWPVGQRPQRTSREVEQHNAQIKKSNRESIKMILPFALLVLVFLLLLFRYLGRAGTHADLGEQANCAEGDRFVQVKAKDTCWEIAQAHGLGVKEILALAGNEKIDCDHLRIGQKICVPN